MGGWLNTEMSDVGELIRLGVTGQEGWVTKWKFKLLERYKPTRATRIRSMSGIGSEANIHHEITDGKAC